MLVSILQLKLVMTNLNSESIFSVIKSFLQDPTTSDEDLIFAVGQASSADSQWLSKLSKVKRSKGRVNMLNLSKQFQSRGM